MSVRLTVEQARLIFGKPKPAAGPAKLPRTKKRREDLPENQNTATILGFLRIKGWRVERQQSGLFNRPHADSRVPIRIGKKGQCDYRCTRLFTVGNARRRISVMHYFELEVKAKGKTPSEEQLTYIRNCNDTGITAVWFDSPRDFWEWYRTQFPEECSNPL